jgi:hypothetical protein
MPYKGYLRGVKVINVTEGDIFFGGSGERSLFPSSGEGCPVGAGWFGATQNHPVRLRLTPLQSGEWGVVSGECEKSLLPLPPRYKF